jgi:hypothetical protein
MHSGVPGPAGAAGADGGWTQLETGFTWNDLVLPQAQEEILQSASATLESGGRLRLLFTGGPGTGKTMACQILGARSGAPVLSLDASGKDVVDSVAAEELLRAAGRVRAVVVIDHADLLLRGRRESRHSVDGLDGAALVTRAAAHGGAVVFTSTSTRAIKDELLAQFDCIVDFPFPDRRGRKEIWRRLLPEDSRLTDADLDHVADRFQLPGATIRESCALAVLAAEAQAAPVTLAHVVRALELEYGDRLTGDSTYAALEELRRRAGVADDADQDPTPAPIEPSQVPARRLRFALRVPRRSRPPGVARPPRRLLRGAMVAIAILVIAGAGFLAGRATSSQDTHPAAAKRVAPGAATPPGAPASDPSTSYATGLESVVSPLHRTRTILGPRLRKTPSWAGAADLAARLAAAYSGAATSLRALHPGSATATAANAALIDGFAQPAAAYRALGHAELDHSHAERSSAMAALHRANAAGAAAYAQLRSLGYSVP